MLTMSALVVAVALPCLAQVRQLPTDTTTIVGTIETIDQGKRAMNIKTPDGMFVAVNVPESVQRFNELKVGDKINATYNNNVMVRLKPPGEPAVDTVATGDAKLEQREVDGQAGRSWREVERVHRIPPCPTSPPAPRAM